MADEAGEVRAVLRRNWLGPGELVWVEAAHGGTVGAPDVFVPLGRRRGYFPLELKWWNSVSHERGGVEFKARPAQRRFHRLAASAGQRTAFLARLSNGHLVLLPGERFPADEGDPLQRREAAHWLRKIDHAMNELISTLLDETFWRGKTR